MPIYALGDVEPVIHPDAYVHPDAVVIGAVTIGAESSVWPGAVLRGDESSIVIGARCNVQDGAVIHVTVGVPTTVHDEVLVAHLAHLESCTVHDGAFIGTASLVLNRVVVGAGAVVAGNTVLLDDMVVPPGALAVGTPATIKEGRARTDLARIGAAHYVREANRYKRELRRLD